MKPTILIGEVLSPNGTVIKLTRRGDEYAILADGKILMSSRMHGSEDAMAQIACRHARTVRRPNVLVGGLGMGFTLRAALDCVPADATVLVVEMLSAVVEWNRGPLAALAGNPLQDRRVTLEINDVVVTLRARPGQLDAVLLDVDNGPEPLANAGNAGLYDERGIAALYGALNQGGIVAVWSAREDHNFADRLRAGGFVVRMDHVRGRRKQRGPRHTIIVGCKAATVGGIF